MTASSSATSTLIAGQVRAAGPAGACLHVRVERGEDRTAPVPARLPSRYLHLLRSAYVLDRTERRSPVGTPATPGVFTP